ncbi:hypothetical protein F7R14_08570 [Pseudomonas lini]|uniref:Uncharacterized protein n=1 Tax=Pseudomonas lini TaxID=163011 RepID=A0A7V7P623_9PSED|nr:hypothetical protein F7R14_08570 [Pseudomonas lini]
MPAKASLSRSSPASLAPTGNQVQIRGFALRKHETFVMKLNGLRLNVTYLAGCRTFADSAKMGCRTLSFT